VKQAKYNTTKLHGRSPDVAQNSHHKDITKWDTKYEQNWHKTKIQYCHKI